MCIRDRFKVVLNDTAGLSEAAVLGAPKLNAGFSPPSAGLELAPKVEDPSPN